MIERDGYRFENEAWAEAWLGFIKKHRNYGNIRAGGSPAYRDRQERERLERQNTVLKQRLDQVAQGNEAMTALERENRKLRAELRKARMYINQTAQAMRRLAEQTATMGDNLCAGSTRSSPERLFSDLQLQAHTRL